MKPDFIKGELQSGALSIPVVSSGWSLRDKVGALKVRWSVGRMNYRVKPGIYAVGSPDRNSNVYVTANYKLSFDHLRRALDGMDGWILVLDTRGINVWCAAGKKTFGTNELVNRIRTHQLDQVVDHRKIILPQLGATGVAAHEVKEQTGFSVFYGPVRASDIKEYVNAGMKATEEMRLVRFPLIERLKLIPVDAFYGKYYMILVPALFFILSGLSGEGYSVNLAISSGWRSVVNLFAGYLSGILVTPALLPWIPFRRFAVKGILSGFLVSILLLLTGMLGTNPPGIISWFLMIGGISSFMAMNFTGSSTFTSLSGVQKEMKVMFPVQMILAGLGIILWIVSRFINL
jgi:hypothetical protein